MRLIQRASIALICGAYANHNKSYRSVYDYSRGCYCAFGINILEINNISVFDYNRGCYITGRINSLFDYGIGNYVNISKNGTHFQGFDYASGQYFFVVVNNQSVSFYDYETSSYYNFSIS